MTPANINSRNLPKSSGIFHDIKSMDGRLERLEETFYNYAYDSTRVLTSFHKNTKILESLINELTIKNEISDKSLKKIERTLPHTCPLVPKEGKTVIKRKKEYLTFSFDLQIKDLKNFTNLISQIKQSNLRFKIIRHKQKKNAFIRRIFENFKRN